MTFKKDGPKKEVNSMAMPDNSGSVDDYRELRHSKPKKLILQTDLYKPAKSRQQLYEELIKGEEILDQDVFEYASYVQRGMAFLIDILFLFVLYKIVIFIAPYEYKLAQYCMGLYKLEFILGNAFLEKIILIMTSVFIIFMGIIVPVAFYNNSFGKKIFNLKVRGVETYSISIETTIVRELIAKPISIGLLIGFFLPFFNKERKSLHDKLMKTFVIKG